MAAEEALASLDVAIFVVTADPPIAAAERDLLARTSALSVRTFVVLNKADQLSEADLRAAEAFTAQVVDKATGVRAHLSTCSVRGIGLNEASAIHAVSNRPPLVHRTIATTSLCSWAMGEI